MKKLYLSILFSLLCIIGIHAQKLNVESFVAKTNDITARTQPRQDINGNDCALVKVRLAADNASFSGNVVRNVAYDKSEYYVYMPHGSKRLTIKLEGYLPLDVNFEEYDIKSLEGKVVYVMTIAGVTGSQQLETPKTKTGWIILDSDPSGASVYINDEFVGNTPLSNYKQAYGTYQYKLESPNYHPATGVIELNAGRFEQKITLKPAFGSISVKSNIAGAKIVLDGKQTGKQTPATLTEIPSGSHTISLQKDKYAPRQQEVMVEDGQTANVSMTLDARFARITINSIDGAEIYSNGKLLGKGRISEDLMEGYYDIEVRLDHHKSVTKQIQVIAGKSEEITLNPVPKYGSLDIVSTPHDASVTIDGKSYGKTPLTVEQLMEGEHTVQLTLDNYQPETKIITIIEKQTVSLQISLNNSLQYYFDLGRNSYESNDYSQAAKWFLKAAEQGDAQAQTKLGVMYFKGKGVPQNYNEAAKWYTKAAEQGDAKAQSSLGSMYVQGIGVPQNDYEAFKWYTKAAEQGLANAQDAVGFMYYKGIGVPQNDYEAVRWYTKAAEQGFAGAQHNLAVMYESGRGVNHDYNEAVRWYTKAAEQGNASAQFNLGVVYEYGHGVNKDYNEAIKWYKKAADQGNAKAKKALERLR